MYKRQVLQVDEGGGLPADQDLVRAGERPDVLDQGLALPAEAGLAGGDLEQPGVRVQRHGRGDGGRAGQGRDPVTQRVHPGLRARRVAAGRDHDLHGLQRVGREVGTQGVGDRAAARTGGQRSGTDGGEGDLQERQSEQHQQRAGADRDQRGPPHDPAGQREPAALGVLRRLQRAAEPGRGQEVDVPAEQSQHRGQHQQRDQQRRGGDQQTADRHRVEEALAEDEQRGHRGAHGERAEQDGAARGVQGDPDRPVDVGLDRHLAAEAGDDQQAVVDREAEAERGDQVEREDRHRGELVDHPQAEQGQDDVQAADDQRQRGGHQTAEDPQREQEQHREGQEFGPLQVVLDGADDLVADHLAAAELDRGVAVEPVGQPVDGVLVVVLRAVLESADHDRPPPVLGDQVLVLGPVVRQDVGEGRVPGHQSGDLVDLLPGAGVVHRGTGVDQGDDAAVALDAGGRADPVVRPDAARPRGDEVRVAAGQRCDDGRADEGRHRGHHHGAQHHHPGMPVRQPCDQVHHAWLLSRVAAGALACSAGPVPPAPGAVPRLRAAGDGSAFIRRTSLRSMAR